MFDWVVVISRRGTSKWHRVLVENIQEPNEAERLALLKLGLPTKGLEARAYLIDDKVSTEEPNISGVKELYEKAIKDLSEMQQEYQQTYSISVSYLERAEQAEKERDRVIERHSFALAKLGTMRSIFDDMKQVLEKKIK